MPDRQEPGAVAGNSFTDKKYDIMKTTNHISRTNLFSFNANSFFRSLTALVALFSLLSLASPRVVAQGTRFVSLGELAHSIQYPSGTFNTGDSVTIEIHIGLAGVSVDSVVGMQLELEYTDYASTPEIDQLDLSTSWLTASCGLDDSSYVDGSAKTVYIDATRDDGTFISGMGQIAKLTLVCNGNGLSAEDLVASLDGGILIIENVDMKFFEQEPATVSFRSYPNPVASNLHLEGMSKGEYYHIFDMGGQVVRSGSADKLGQQVVEMGSLPKGLYILQTSTGIRQKLIVN